MKTSVKLPFVTKNSKHLVGTSDDDSSAVITNWQHIRQNSFFIYLTKVILNKKKISFSSTTIRAGY